MISDCISDNIPPKMKILNIVIPILIHFCSFVSNWSVESRIKQHIIKKKCQSSRYEGVKGISAFTFWKSALKIKLKG